MVTSITRRRPTLPRHNSFYRKKERITRMNERLEETEAYRQSTPLRKRYEDQLAKLDLYGWTATKEREKLTARISKLAA